MAEFDQRESAVGSALAEIAGGRVKPELGDVLVREIARDLSLVASYQGPAAVVAPGGIPVKDYVAQRLARPGVSEAFLTPTPLSPLQQAAQSGAPLSETQRGMSAMIAQLGSAGGRGAGPLAAGQADFGQAMIAHGQQINSGKPDPRVSMSQPFGLKPSR